MEYTYTYRKVIVGVIINALCPSWVLGPASPLWHTAPSQCGFMVNYMPCTSRITVYCVHSGLCLCSHSLGIDWIWPQSPVRPPVCTEEPKPSSCAPANELYWQGSHTERSSCLHSHRVWSSCPHQAGLSAGSLMCSSELLPLVP